jgi:CubicO group peptidase (beta-lactamase class C family)
MDIYSLIQKYLKDNGAIGAAVGFIDKSHVQLFSYGKESIQANKLVSEESIFEIGSITKVFTTLTLIDMETNGEVELDEPIETYLPGIAMPKMVGKKITLRHLATHHSGLPRLPDNLNPKNLMNPYADYSTEDLYHFLNHYNLPRSPEKLFEYSNIGMGLLGHILSKKTDQNYEELICRRVCDQLEMKNTAISLSADMKKNFAKGYHQTQETEHWDIPALAGAGGLRSNIKDMTRFLSANMGLIPLPIKGLLKQCHKQQFTIGLSEGVGLGWMISHDNGSEIIWHNGGTGGFRTFLGFNPEMQRGIVILSNSSEDWPDELSFGLLDPTSPINNRLDKIIK